MAGPGRRAAHVRRGCAQATAGRAGAHVGEAEPEPDARGKDTRSRSPEARAEDDTPGRGTTARRWSTRSRGGGGRRHARGARGALGGSVRSAALGDVGLARRGPGRDGGR